MPTAEERKAAAARRAREYRARKREVRVAEDAARAKSGPAPTTQRDAVGEALAAMKWLEPSDAASVAQARTLAKLVDELEHEGQIVRALSAHRALSRVLNDLAATPAARLQRELRSLRAGAAPKADGGDGGNDEASTSGNVSKFQRPAKRKRGA